MKCATCGARIIDRGQGHVHQHGHCIAYLMKCLIVVRLVRVLEERSYDRSTFANYSRRVKLVYYKGGK